MEQERSTFFRREEKFEVIQRRLPHWTQAGTLSFLTFRTHDSMPASVMANWIESRNRILETFGIDATDGNWLIAMSKLPSQERFVLRRRLGTVWHGELDRCLGSCELRQPNLAKLVADSLLHFDRDRYLLTDFVVMPNHVHLVAAFPSEEMLLTQCRSWKRFTATGINRELGRSGRFWQQDGFDHLIRTESEFQFLREYVALNPVRARLREGEYVHWARPADELI